MKITFTLPLLLIGLTTMTGCVTLGPTKTTVKSDVYYCAKSGKNIKTATLDDGTLELEYFNRVVSMQPESFTIAGSTYKNKQMMWQVKGETAVLSSLTPEGRVNSQLDQCKLSQTN